MSQPRPRIAFYAPLKPPDWPVPSGDRQIARHTIAALRCAGADVVIASRLRAYEGLGCAQRQADIRTRGGVLAKRLMRRYRVAPRRPDAWLTYHVYHKAPDWIGPPVTAGLGIPYAVMEAAVSPKQADGPWGEGYRQTIAAVRAADVIFSLNRRDNAVVTRHARAESRQLQIPPFADLAPFLSVQRMDRGDGKPVRIATVAMMRAGDKLSSFRMLADALGRLADLDWTLTVIGDGPARPQVEAAMLETGLGQRITWAGACDTARIATELAGHDIVAWPAVNEAIGMALLEAQAAGCAVVAGRYGAVDTIITDTETGLLAPPGDAAAFAQCLAALITDPARCTAMGAAGRRRAKRAHTLEAAGGPLLSALLDRTRAPQVGASTEATQ